MKSENATQSDRFFYVESVAHQENDSYSEVFVFVWINLSTDDARPIVFAFEYPSILKNDRPTTICRPICLLIFIESEKADRLKKLQSKNSYF